MSSPFRKGPGTVSMSFRIDSIKPQASRPQVVAFLALRGKSRWGGREKVPLLRLNVCKMPRSQALQASLLNLIACSRFP